MKITYANSKIEKCFNDYGLMKKKIGYELTRNVKKCVLALRRVLRVSSLSNLNRFVPQGAFRILDKHKIEPVILGAWLRMCQIENEKTVIHQSFQPTRATELISELKSLMLTCPVCELQKELCSIFADYGIAFSIVQYFKGAPVHGYISKKDNGSYQMTLTIRNSWEDIFWFSLFHEIGHIINQDIGTKKKEFVDFDNNEQ